MNVRFLGILALLTATACGVGTSPGLGGGTSDCDPTVSFCQPPVIPTPPAITYAFCPLPNPNPPQLVYPNPNIPIAAGSVNEIVVADVSAAPYQIGPGAYGYYVVFSTLNSQTAFANSDQDAYVFSAFSIFKQISANQLPSGTATPTIPSPVYEAATESDPSPFSTRTQYFAYLTINANQCLPSGPAGSFTTQ